jgi:hypothetical protein
MKRLWLVLGLALFVALPTGQALAYDIIFFLGDPSDNVTTLEVVVDRFHYLNHKMTMKPIDTDTGPGYLLTLVKTDDGDPCQDGKNPPAPRGNGKMLHMPGSEDLSSILVQLTDINHFNETHKITFYWLDQCQRLALVMAETK